MHGEDILALPLMGIVFLLVSIANNTSVIYAGSQGFPKIYRWIIKFQNIKSECIYLVSHCCPTAKSCKMVVIGGGFRLLPAFEYTPAHLYN